MRLQKRAVAGKVDPRLPLIAPMVLTGCPTTSEVNHAIVQHDWISIVYLGANSAQRSEQTALFKGRAARNTEPIKNTHNSINRLDVVVRTDITVSIRRRGAVSGDTFESKQRRWKSCGDMRG